MTVADLHLVRVDPARNMARFYGLSLEVSLFSDHTLVRRWGRIGTRGRTRTELFSTRDAALAGFEKLARVKRARGYREPAERIG